MSGILTFLRSPWPQFREWATSKPHAARSMSLLRILYGLGILALIVPSYADRSYLWGEASFWVDPIAGNSGNPLFGVIFSKTSPTTFDLVYIAMILVTLLFIAGYKTRFVTPVLLVLFAALGANNPYATNGGDNLYRITLVFLLFADLSRHFSVDSWLRRRRESRGLAPRKPWLPVWLTSGLHNAALVLCCYQIILVYVASGLYKLQGYEWIEGSGFYYSLVIPQFQIYPGLDALIWQSSLFVMIATWVSVWGQLLFPIGLLWKPMRVVMILLLACMHLGIAVLLGLWPFSLAMIALDLLFIRDESWERLARGTRELWVRTARAGRRLFAAEPEPAA